MRFVFHLQGKLIRNTSARSACGQTVADTCLKCLGKWFDLSFDWLYLLKSLLLLRFRLNFVFGSLKKRNYLHFHFRYNLLVKFVFLFAFHYASLNFVGKNLSDFAQFDTDCPEGGHSLMMLNHTLSQLRNVLDVFMINNSCSFIHLLGGKLHFLRKGKYRGIF
jgi:hypothetical protein